LFFIKFFELFEGVGGVIGGRGDGFPGRNDFVGLCAHLAFGQLCLLFEQRHSLRASFEEGFFSQNIVEVDPVAAFLVEGMQFVQRIRVRGIDFNDLFVCFNRFSDVVEILVGIAIRP
jgi:hypothetical protein